MAFVSGEFQSDPGAAAPSQGTATVPVWDRFVRFFHWAVVGLFAIAFLTPEALPAVHEAAGYAILALVALRLVWGFIGPDHARFRSFLSPPGQIAAFLLASLRGRAPRVLGHNPAGGAMAALLMLMLLVITLTGIAQTIGPLQRLEWLEDAHEAAVFATLGLIALHLLGVAIASIEHHENLVRAMVTGRKRPLRTNDPATRG